MNGIGENLSDNFTLKYQDEDSDMVVIQDQDDWEMALEDWDQESKPVQEIFIENVAEPELARPPEDDPESSDAEVVVLSARSDGSQSPEPRIRQEEEKENDPAP